MIKKILQEYHQDLKSINQIISSSLNSSNKYINKLNQNINNFPRKQLRPLITLILSKNSKIDQNKIYTFASIYEMIHIASLIHDDVIDNCSKRHNKETLNKEFGDGVAILLGDFIFSNIFKKTAEINNNFTKNVAKTISCLIQGELKQQENRSLKKQTLKNYLEIISYKTSSLLELVCFNTLHELGHDKTICQAGKQFAHAFGQIFQISDDWKDYKLKSISKDCGIDAINNFITLPWLLLYKSANRQEKINLEKLWISNKNSLSTTSLVIELTNKYKLENQIEEKIFSLYSHTQNSLTILAKKIDICQLQCLLDSIVTNFNK